MTKNLSSKEDCPFCRNNNLLRGAIVATSPIAYMITSLSNPHNYLIIPETHVESVQELPDTWWQDVKTLISQAPHLAPDYNLSLNVGSIAGQTVKHLHLWVIPRRDSELASNNGLASLIEKVNRGV